LLRSSLRSLELQLPSHIFLRDHQRYIVNLWKIENYKGNAQGFFTKLKETNIVLKVSRKYMRVFQDRIARISTPEIVMTRNDPDYLFW